MARVEVDQEQGQTAEEVEAIKDAMHRMSNLTSALHYLHLAAEAKGGNISPAHLCQAIEHTTRAHVIAHKLWTKLMYGDKGEEDG